MLACFGFGKSKEKPVSSFTSFVVKVDPTVVWESTMAKILKKTKLEISSLKMYGEGMFQVSGKLDPKILLKVLGKTDKTAFLVGLQSGGCSQNLYMPEFEQRQRYKQCLKDGAEMQAYYNDFYQGYGQSYYVYNNGNGYVRNYGHPQYLHG
ncbi:uncharacterized protein LOC141693893 [Apium graveolens]|uniref:uncharacterized protein LOC141693893 n=1 Tax=Apium graveolens TaxID=4045 RepID=UPI003D7966C3